MLFFFLLLTPPQHPTPFPTRRSSDLLQRHVFGERRDVLDLIVRQVQVLQLAQALERRQVFDLVLRQIERRDRKSTRLNSSHRTISYAVFCLKKKTNMLSHVSRWLFYS